MDMDMGGCFSALVVHGRGLATFFNFDEADLKKGAVEVEGRLVDAVFPKDGNGDGGGNYHAPPICGGCCRVGRSLFLLGGFVLNPGIAEDDIHSRMWSIDIDAATAAAPPSACCTWSTVTSLSNPRTPERIYQPLAIPCGRDMLFVLGGMPGDSSPVTELWMDVYDTKTKPPKRVRSLPLPDFLSEEDIPYSYFLWEKEEGKNPLIMLAFRDYCAPPDDEPPPHRLVSYDADEDSWELIGPVLPAFHVYARCFVLFDRDTLVIIDNPFYWPVYDMRSNTVTHQLELQYMNHLQRFVTGVIFCSYRRCSFFSSCARGTWRLQLMSMSLAQK